MMYWSAQATSDGESAPKFIAEIQRNQPELFNDFLLLAVAQLYRVKVTLYSAASGQVREQLFQPPAATPLAGELHLCTAGAAVFIGARRPAPPPPPAPPPEPGSALWVFIDFESTGLLVGKDRITQAAAFAYTTPGAAAGPGAARAACRGRFSCMVRPGVPVSPEAAAITGFTTAALEGYPGFDAQGPALLAWLADLTRAAPAEHRFLVAHNGIRCLPTPPHRTPPPRLPPTPTGKESAEAD